MCQLPRACKTQHDHLNDGPADSASVDSLGEIPELGLALLKVAMKLARCMVEGIGG